MLTMQRRKMQPSGRSGRLASQTASTQHKGKLKRSSQNRGNKQPPPALPCLRKLTGGGRCPGQGAGGAPGCHRPMQRNPRSWNNHFVFRSFNIAMPKINNWKNYHQQPTVAPHRGRRVRCWLLVALHSMHGRQTLQKNTTDDSPDGAREAG
jgi:hypothetical protein